MQNVVEYIVRKLLEMVQLTRFTVPGNVWMKYDFSQKLLIQHVRNVNHSC